MRRISKAAHGIRDRPGGWLCRLVWLVCLMGALAGLAQNRVLECNGSGASLEFPAGMLDEVEELTLEGWFQWIRFNRYSPVLSFGERYRMLGLNNHETEATLQLFLYDDSRALHRILVRDILNLDEWVHVAAIAGSDGMKLYFNGVLVGTNAYARGLTALPKDPALVVGRSFWEGTQGFVGRVDDLRFWRGERTPAEIRRDMHRTLTGAETGLLAWFDFEDGTASDRGPGGFHGALKQGAMVTTVAALPDAESLPRPALVSGRVAHGDATPAPGVAVGLWADDGSAREITTDAVGRYQFVYYPSGRGVDLSATWRDQGAWRFHVLPEPGGIADMPMVLEPAVTVSGRVEGLDGEPRTGVLVQLVTQRELSSSPSAHVVAAASTDDKGYYQFINTRPGRYWVRCHASERLVYHGEGNQEPSAVHETAHGALDVRPGETISKVNFKFASFQRGHWRTLTFMDELPANSVLSIVQDAAGFLWFGTEHSGAIRFDGQQMMQLTMADGLPDDKVNDIHPDPHGVLWFATTRGLARHERGVVTVYDVDQGLPHDYVESIVPDTQGGLWLGTRDGLCRFKEGVVEVLTTDQGLAGNQVRTLFRDREGTLWVGTTGGVSQWTGDGFRNFTTGDGLVDNDVWAITQSEDGVMWFGTGSRGISLYDGTRFRTYDTGDGLVDDAIRRLLLTKDGTVWVATKGGVSRYRRGTLGNYRREDGLAHGEVWEAFQARDGSVWFGTRRGGVARFEPAGHWYLTSRDGLAGNQITALSRAPGGPLWIGSVGAVSCFDGQRVQTFTLQDGLPGTLVNAVSAGADDRVWVATDEGLTLIEGRRISPRDRFPALFGKHVTDVALGSGEEAWVTTYGSGLFHYDGNILQRFPRYVGTGGGFLTAAYYSPEDILWTGSRHVGRHGGEEDRLFTDEDGLNLAEINVLTQDRTGNLWVGSRTGLLTMQRDRFVPVRMGEGLVPNSIDSISVATNGHMWFGTQAGAFVFDGQNWSLLDTRDGLPGHDINATWPDPDGSMWLATENGLLNYRRGNVPPRVRILHVRSRQVYAGLQDPPRLPLGIPVTIDVGAIDFRTHPRKRSYRYQLIPAQGPPSAQEAGPRPDQWGRATRRSTLEWLPERPGWYLFAVQAIDRDLNYSEPAVLWLRVITPWFEDGRIIVPASILIVLLVGASVWSTWSYVVKRRQTGLAEARIGEQEAFSRRLIDQQEGERKRIANELHDSLGQSLLVMKNRALMGLQGAPDPDRMNSQLGEISELASQAISDARDIAFNLRPQHLDSLGLDKAIAAMARKVCASAALDLNLDLEDLAGLLPPEAQTHVFRIVQEGLNNVVKHAEASRVHLRISQGGQALHIHLEDDGRGISDTTFHRKRSSGLGTTSLTERVKILAGTLDRRTAPGAGTLLSVEIPLPVAGR